MIVRFGLLIISTLITINTQAQFWLPTPENALMVEGRTLLIEEADFICNPDVVSQFKKHWIFGGEVLGKTEEEINALLTPQNAKQYLVLTGDSKEEQKVYKGKHLLQEVVSIAIYPGENAGKRNYLDVNREWVGKMGLPSCLVSEEEVMFFVHHLANHIQMVKGKENPTNRKKSVISKEMTLSLKNKTLLLPQEKMALTEADFSKYYKEKTKMVSVSEIKSAVSENKAGFAYLNVLWNDKRFEWDLVVVDCESSQVLATCRYDGFRVALMKKKFDTQSEFLPIYRTKSQIGLVEMKFLGKSITKAEAPAR
ncbi:MAG: hypothetical protein ACPGEG_08775 [Salibacteraceae bacterium]